MHLDTENEKISTALDSYTRWDLAARRLRTAAAVEAQIRAYNHLLDLCIDAGMDRNDEPDTWAAARVAAWLSRAA